MKYVKIFEQFVNEILDPKSAYPFVKNKVVHDDDGNLHGLQYNFNSQAGTAYHATLVRDPSRTYYDFNFRPKEGKFETMTGEKDALRIITTAGQILKHMLQSYEVLPIPVKIKGVPKRGESKAEESSRDRIYKHILFKDLSNIKPGNPLIQRYDMIDVGPMGFIMEPRSIDQDEFDDELNPEELETVEK